MSYESQKLHYVPGDVLDDIWDFVGHQCNCVTRKPGGLSKAVFAKHPEANTYASNDPCRVPGTISVHGRVINMYGQKTPGKPKRKGTDDDAAARKDYFITALSSALLYVHSRGLEEGKVRTLALPYKIGCGLAGGDWRLYEQYIANTVATVCGCNNLTHVRVYIVRLG